MASDLPVELYQNATIRALEKTAIKTAGLSSSILMARAGSALFAVLQEKWPEIERLVVMTGPGNNGGDGYVLARLAYQAGLDVSIYYLGDLIHLKGAALEAKQQCDNVAIPMNSFEKSFANDAIEDIDLEADVIVDAIFGIGIAREIVGEYKKAIDVINLQPSYILSVDTPSGINTDTGQVLGSAVCADVTCTFMGLKQGLLTGQAPDYTGEIMVSPLGIPREIYDSISCDAYRITAEYCRDLLVSRHPTAHKGDFGHVLVIGGNEGMPGSVRMAAEAALRVGAGLVTVATRPHHVNAIVSMRPEIMCHGINNHSDLEPLLARTTVVVLGPGLGQDEWATDLCHFILQQHNLPLVIDADALNLLAKEPKASPLWILTPHPGEAARLLDCTTQEIQNDRFAAIHSLQKKYAGVILLKGKGSLVLGPEYTPYLIDAGNPGMASGGMGDILSGIIGGLIAQGLTSEEAVAIGTFIHATAGDLAAKSGERGLIASDLMPFLRQLVNM